MVYKFKKQLAILIITLSLLVTLITAVVSYRSMESVLREEYDGKAQEVEKSGSKPFLIGNDPKGEAVQYPSGFQNRVDSFKKEFIPASLCILLLSFAVIHAIFRLLSTPLYLAFHDSLTGLGNRAAFEGHLERLLKKRGGKPVLMMLDLDNFKLINDSFGHDEGDSFLFKAGQAIKESAGRASIAARIGGDEFAVIFPAAHEEDIEEIALKMMLDLERLLHTDASIKMLDVTFSVGIAFAEAGDDVETLYKKADIALYESKKQGKNQYRIFNDKFSGSVRITEEALKFFL